MGKPYQSVPASRQKSALWHFNNKQILQPQEKATTEEEEEERLCPGGETKVREGVKQAMGVSMQSCPEPGAIAGQLQYPISLFTENASRQWFGPSEGAHSIP